GLPVDEILGAWRDQADAAPPGVVFRGGPVSPDAVIGLARSADGAGSAGGPGDPTPQNPAAVDGPPDPFAVDPGGGAGWRIVVAGVGTVDLAVAPEDQPVVVAGVRMFAGYAGWSPTQLDTELDEGAWIVLDALVDDIFTGDAQNLWHDVLQRQGGKLALLAAYPPHPSVN
ncbi:MAG: YqgE/AlgH family protein, partial [Acidimicrobiales bacterium]